LHSFDFAFGLACALAGKGKCVQCAVAKIFVGGTFFYFFFVRLPFKAVSVVVPKSSKKFVKDRQFDVSTVANRVSGNVSGVCVGGEF